MTAVLKNSFDGTPDENYGATMYKKRRKPPQAAPIKLDSGVVKLDSGVDKTDYSVVKECMARVDNSSEKARKRRERRLYTHLGMKGFYGFY